MVNKENMPEMQFFQNCFNIWNLWNQKWKASADVEAIYLNV